MLVVSGLTDGAVAHRLGVSERTVQRRVRELMEGSGSRNRMQLGHHAALATSPARHHDRPVSWGGAGALDDSALRLLRVLLDDGRADRLLGVSPRSVERRVQELMALAGARSRAQLGWRATRRGWL